MLFKTHRKLAAAVDCLAETMLPNVWGIVIEWNVVLTGNK